MLRWTLQQSQRHRLLGLSLLALHGAFLAPMDQGLHLSMILLHFGLILLWQPFFDGSQRFNRLLTGLVLVVGFAMLIWGGWLIIAAWTLILLGLIAGESSSSWHDTVAQWLAITHLFIVLLAGVAPAIFDVAGADHPALHALLVGAGILPLMLLAIRAGTPGSGPMRFDHLRSPGVTLLTLVLVAGAVLWSFQSGVIYPVALIQTLPVAGALILIVNWIWQRASAHSMIQLLWNRYLLNLGTPFEQYLMRLTGPAAQSLEPGEYLDHVVTALHELEWIEGVEAQAPDGERRVGDCSHAPTRLGGDQLALTVYTHKEPSPSLRLHIQLLLRLAHQLWDARQREAELQNQARIRAVYETGARLTHDTKNLLQSLQSLTAAVSDSPPERAGEALELVKKQLPPINQRLHATLEKLREPGDGEADDEGGEPADLREWWDGLQTRYAGDSVRFAEVAPDMPDGIIPRDVFDTVTENLLDNARYKQTIDRDVKIEARLSATNDGVQLEVIDSGEAMPADKASQLFRGVVDSAQGLGVGLYQAARVAAAYDYELALLDNQSGQVRFGLRGPLYTDS